MARVLNLPMSFFRKYSSGELVSRMGAVSTLCNILLGNILFTALSAALALLYVAQIFRFAPVLVWPSIGIIIITLAVGMYASVRQIRITREKMKLTAKQSGMSYAMINGIQKIRVSGAEKRAFARWAGLYAKNAALEYDPPVFLKIHTVITTGIALAGKSTLLRVLMGFEKPEKGAVYYDGKDLNSLDPQSLRRKMGVVNQNGQLFGGDIFSNITIAAPYLTQDEAWEAAETAGIAEDIRSMPMGMRTFIPGGGGGISFGQKQRLMIARAVAPKPKILIFDEATSALDNKTQKQIADALESLQCTRIVVAHRLSTIRGCDRILAMDKGAIIEEGTYEELIARNGIFAELAERQRLDV